jgi:hypothetical protein
MAVSNVRHLRELAQRVCDRDTGVRQLLDHAACQRRRAAGAPFSSP